MIFNFFKSVIKRTDSFFKLHRAFDNVVMLVNLFFKLLNAVICQL